MLKTAAYMKQKSFVTLYIYCTLLSLTLSDMVLPDHNITC